MKKSRSLLVVGTLGLALWSSAAFGQGVLWDTYMEAGEQAYGQGRYAEAEKALQAALTEAEHFGPQDPRLAASLNNLALLYHAQGKYAEAEPLLKRALAIFEKALGPEHPNVATSLENYAVLLRKMNRQAEAAELEARARAIRTKRARENPPK